MIITTKTANEILTDPAPITPTERVVYLRLLWHRSPVTGVCNPGQSRLANDLHIHRETIVNAIAHLEEMGWLKRIRIGKTKTNQYDLRRFVFDPLDPDQYEVIDHNDPSQAPVMSDIPTSPIEVMSDIPASDVGNSDFVMSEFPTSIVKNKEERIKNVNISKDICVGENFSPTHQTQIFPTTQVPDEQSTGITETPPTVSAKKFHPRKVTKNDGQPDFQFVQAVAQLMGHPPTNYGVARKHAKNLLNAGCTIEAIPELYCYCKSQEWIKGGVDLGLMASQYDKFCDAKKGGGESLSRFEKQTRQGMRIP